MPVIARSQGIFIKRTTMSRQRLHPLGDPAFFRAVHVDPGGYGISWNEDVDLSEHELRTNGEPVGSSVPGPVD